MNKTKAVPPSTPHRHSIKEGNAMKPDLVLHDGKTKIFAPEPMSKEELERRKKEMYHAAWALKRTVKRSPQTLGER